MMEEECPRCKSKKVREFTIHEFSFEHPNNMFCMDCNYRWIEIKPKQEE